MVQRYVRVKTTQAQTYYGLLQLDRSVQVLDAPSWLGGQPTDLKLEPETYELLAPCAPTKIIAVGKNYSQHAAEMGGEVPKEPLLFLKPPTAITAHEKPIYYPQATAQVDYEGELAIVIGERIRYCPPEQARGKLWGYTIANDVTARDLQRKDGQWTRAKGFDSFCPLGPWIVRDLSAGATLQTFINDETQPRQSALLTEMVFSIEQLVSQISDIMTLVPGDVILTGTPAGVGAMQINDRVRIEIEGIGSLENYLIPSEQGKKP